MKTSLQDFSSELTRRVAHFLWRQWAQVGLASASVEPRDGWIVDPEALLLLSGTYGRYDPRLFDEIMDWLLKNANFVNIPRLKSVLKRYDFAGQRVLAAMAAKVMEENRRLHWLFPPARAEGESEPLFLNADGTPMPEFGAPDPGFLKSGFRRGKVDLRGLSRRFNAVMPECALLRLRALFGVSARADVMLYLLTHEKAHPSGIARDTGFSQKNVQDTLVDMAASGLVVTRQLEGRMKHYSVLPKHRPDFLYKSDRPGLMPRWIAWPPIFRALEVLLAETRRMASQTLSDQLLASELRRVAERIRPLAQQAGVAESFSEATRVTGIAYTTVFVEETEAWLAGVLGEQRQAESKG
jgi:hypothetical protein